MCQLNILLPLDIVDNPLIIESPSSPLASFLAFFPTSRNSSSLRRSLSEMSDIADVRRDDVEKLEIFDRTLSPILLKNALKVKRDWLKSNRLFKAKIGGGEQST